MHRFRHVIARKPGANVGQGLTTAELGAPDFDLMCAQHDAYLRALATLGIEITLLEPDPRYPDGCFVEDVAIVTPACIVMTRPGAPSRRGEGAAIEPLLAEWVNEAGGDMARIEPPGCVDGGDVIVMDDCVLVGISRRTNHDGASQLKSILLRHGIRVDFVPVIGALHLKSDVNDLGDKRLLFNAAYANCEALADFSHIVVPDGEDYAANCLRCGDVVLMPTGFPGTRERLERAGFSVTELNLSEFRKMDGGLTCLSIRF